MMVLGWCKRQGKGRKLRIAGESETSSDISSQGSGNVRMPTVIMEKINISLPWIMAPTQYCAGFLLFVHYTVQCNLSIYVKSVFTVTVLCVGGVLRTDVFMLASIITLKSRNLTWLTHSYQHTDLHILWTVCACGYTQRSLQVSWNPRARMEWQISECII